MTTESGSIMTKRRRWLALVVLSVSLFIVTLDMTILNLALPRLTIDLAPSAIEQLWIVDIYSLLLAGLLVPMAIVADRYGRKRILLTGFTLFGLASALIIFANSPQAVIAVRALMGVGGSMIMPMTLSLIRVIFTDPKERAFALGVWASISSIGVAVGPLIGGVLLEAFDWHAAFLVNVPLMLFTVFLGAFTLPESKLTDPAPLDFLSIVLVMLGMFALVWAIKSFAKHGLAVDFTVWLLTALGVLLLTLFVIRNLRAARPQLDLRLFQSRLFTAGILAALMCTFSLMAVLFFLSQYLQLVYGASPIMTGVYLLPLALCSFTASLLITPVAKRLGASYAMSLALVLLGLGPVLLAIIPGELALWQILLALSLMGAGMGSMTLASALVMLGTPVEKAGNAASLEETAYEFGSLLGIAILGSVVTSVFAGLVRAQSSFQELNPSQLAQASENIGNAVLLAEQLQNPELFAAAATAYTSALQITALVCAVLLFLVAGVVKRLIPKGIDITAAAH